MSSVHEITSLACHPWTTIFFLGGGEGGFVWSVGTIHEPGTLAPRSQLPRQLGDSLYFLSHTTVAAWLSKLTKKAFFNLANFGAKSASLEADRIYFCCHSPGHCVIGVCDNINFISCLPNGKMIAFLCGGLNGKNQTKCFLGYSCISADIPPFNHREYAIDF